MLPAVFEHLAFNVSNMDAVADWYCEHLQMTRVRHDPGKKVFLADKNGVVVFELYSNDDNPRINFHETDPLTLHIAFVVEDAATAIEALVAAGATLLSRAPTDYAGDVLCMFRDPFGLPLQIVSRKTPLIND